MSKVVVIGAGASGIIASLKLTENHEVTLIDGNDKCGKKLLVTGNGKCNYWNEDIDIKNYFTSDKNLLQNILDRKEETYNYLENLGIYPKIKNGYYYPASGLASSIRSIFDRELKRNNIKTMYNTKVLDIKKENDKYIIDTTNGEIECEILVIATGSKAAPKTGSDGFAYNIAKQFGHSINPVLPALTSLKTSDMEIKEWSGVRTLVKLNLYVNDNFIQEEFGEIQLTEDGISGICTFNISSNVSRSLNENKNVVVKINFVPSIDDFNEFMNERNQKLPNRTLEELLESILNYKLTNVILKKSNINKETKWDDLNLSEKELLIKNVTNFEININSTADYEKAQVCTGGIPLGEVNEKMESIYSKNLYFIGELLDVDGKCGGFNLAFAFITGYIVGSSI